MQKERKKEVEQKEGGRNRGRKEGWKRRKEIFSHYGPYFSRLI